MVSQNPARAQGLAVDVESPLRDLLVSWGSNQRGPALASTAGSFKV